MPRKKAEPDSPARRGWGKGSVSYDAKRRQWRARTPRDDRGRRETAYFPTKQEAEAWLSDWIERAANAALPFDPNRTTGEFLRYWYRLNLRRWKPNQQRKVRSQINVCRPIAHHRLRALTAIHVDEFLTGLSDRGLSSGYVHAIGRLVVRALAWAVSRKILSENVAELVELTTGGRKPPKAYTAEEVRTITREARGERFEAAFLLYLHAGIRMGESLGMEWAAIDAENDVVYVEQAEYTAAGREIGTAKYESEGGIDVSPPIIRRLVELREAATTRYILGKPKALRPHDRQRKHSNEERWCDTTVRRDWYALLARLGIRRLTPHGGRHSFATGHMVIGTDLADIADLLRHKSPAITAQTYLSGNRARRKDAAARLGQLFAVPDPPTTQEDAR